MGYFILDELLKLAESKNRRMVIISSSPASHVLNINQSKK